MCATLCVPNTVKKYNLWGNSAILLYKYKKNKTNETDLSKYLYFFRAAFNILKDN